MLKKTPPWRPISIHKKSFAAQTASQRGVVCEARAKKGGEKPHAKSGKKRRAWGAFFEGGWGLFLSLGWGGSSDFVLCDDEKPSASSFPRATAKRGGVEKKGEGRKGKKRKRPGLRRKARKPNGGVRRDGMDGNVAAWWGPGGGEISTVFCAYVYQPMYTVCVYPISALYSVVLSRL